MNFISPWISKSQVFLIIKYYIKKKRNSTGWNSSACTIKCLMRLPPHFNMSVTSTNIRQYDKKKTKKKPATSCSCLRFTVHHLICRSFISQKFVHESDLSTNRVCGEFHSYYMQHIICSSILLDHTLLGIPWWTFQRSREQKFCQCYNTLKFLKTKYNFNLKNNYKKKKQQLYMDLSIMNHHH